MASKGNKEDSRTRIIDSAKRLFAEQGFVKTTVMDISRQAGLSEAALYEYFQGKEDLLLAIPQLWVSELIADLNGQLFGIKGSVNKLRKFLWWNLLRIEQAPLDAKIVYLSLKTNANFLNTEVYANVKRLYSNLIEIFEEGRASGEMRPDLNPYLARDIFVGTMDHIVTRWLLKGMTYPIFDNLEETFSIMVDGFKAVQPGTVGSGQDKEKPTQENGVINKGNEKMNLVESEDVSRQSTANFKL